jgi:hypothetical protein
MNGSARHYPRWVNLVILGPLATVKHAANGSVRYTRKTKGGIAALLNRGMREVRANTGNENESSTSQALINGTFEASL